MSSAASVATMSRYFALLVVRGSDTNRSRGASPSSRNWRTASRRWPASSRSRSRFTSLTERLAQILPGEGLEVEVVVPRACTQLVQERLVAHNQRATLEGMVAECQRRVVERAHVDRVPQLELKVNRQVERVSEAIVPRTSSGVQPDRNVDVTERCTEQKRSVQQSQHDFAPGPELASQVSRDDFTIDVRVSHCSILRHVEVGGVPRAERGSRFARARAAGPGGVRAGPGADHRAARAATSAIQNGR